MKLEDGLMAISVEINPDVTKALIAVAASVFGYAFREYQNRAIPFFQVFKVDGSFAAQSDVIEIPEAICNDLKDSFYIKELESRENYKEVYQHWDHADDVKRFWPKVLPGVQRVLAADSDADLEEGIYQICNSSFFDGWFTRLVARSQIHFEMSDPELPQKTQVFLDPKDEKNAGVLWINTVFGATAFAQGMNNPAMRRRFDGFIDNIEKLDKIRIKKFLSEFKNIMEREYQISLRVVDPLKKLVDACSRWMFFISFANLSNNPLAIEQKASVKVVDKMTRTPYPMDCRLVRISYPDGKRTIEDANAPISLKSGETVEFAIVTIETQHQMSLGADIRNIFERGSGNCEVTLHLQKPGLVKKQTVRSETISFKENKN